MDTTAVGKRLVELTSAGKDPQALDELYADNIVSVEGGSDGGEAQTWEGIEAVREKHAWWDSAATTHETTAEGPYAGSGDDQFVVKFWMDVTMEGSRNQMTEVGLFTVAEGKIVREVYLPLIAG
ncbi:MAG: nuclear transport factor 2 family protein [Pseudomonadales bacterium]|nr:nuclear transport factor 2 family protein [Pseudomonadales bacterium]